jgi:hypothetical protein
MANSLRDKIYEYIPVSKGHSGRHCERWKNYRSASFISKVPSYRLSIKWRIELFYILLLLKIIPI